MQEEVDLVKTIDNKNAGSDLSSNGKLEAHLFLQKWKDVFGSVKSIFGDRDNMKEANSFLFSNFFMVMCMLFCFVVPIVVLGVLFLKSSIIDENLGLLLLSVAVFIAVKFLNVYFDFLNSILSPYVDSFFKNENYYLRKYAESFGFSLSFTRKEDLQKVQDFATWLLSISDNFAKGSYSEGLRHHLSELKSDKKLSKKDYREAVNSCVLYLFPVLRKSLENKEFKEIYDDFILDEMKLEDKKRESGVMYSGDLTKGNKDRLLSLLAKENE